MGHPRDGHAVAESSATVRIRLDISYDGTDFAGWAVQPGLRTVAGVLTEALNTLLRHQVRLVVAGRTDAGVHAVGQVAHLDVDPGALAALIPRDHQADPDRGAAARLGLLRRLSGLLPADLRVRAVSVPPEGFDARFSALRRHYRYRIGTAVWGVEPAQRRFVLARRRRLDIEAMQLAGAALVGLHDFHAFCRPRQGATTIRHLQAVEVHGAGDEVRIDVVADAFCHSMVRSLVGSLLAVGELRMPAGRPGELLAARRRTSDFPVVAPHGLTLIRVDYPPADELATRVAQTRAIRDL